MNIKHISWIVAATVGISAMTGCNIYKKFEMPTDSQLTAEYVKADA